jgi:hypothetical protein
MGPLVWGLYRLTRAKESPKSLLGEQQEMGEVSAFPKPLPLCGNQSKNIPLECMVKNFKKGFNGDYGVKLTPNKLKFFVK